ncbi:MAG: hypothetical protein IJI03_01375 [Rudaea sp.]|nr:hypothetical protein [Rudaea sp.]
MMMSAANKPRLRTALAAFVLGLVCASGAQAVDLSAIPPQVNSSVLPNFVITFDDSGSMTWARMGDYPPYTSGKHWNGPWRCAAVIDAIPPANASDAALRQLPMNAVYYNPRVTYRPPLKPDGTPFPDAQNGDFGIANAPIDGIAVYRPVNAVSASPVGFNNNRDLTANLKVNGNLAAMDTGSTNLTGTGTSAWKCGVTANLNDGYDSYRTPENFTDANPFANSGGGPYYYRLKSGVTLTAVNGVPDPSVLYNAANWEAVQITDANERKNFANWYAYYRTRSQMARTSLSRAFGSLTAANIRVAWQNLGANSPGLLQSSSIITTFTDATVAGITGYRTRFFNWLYQIGSYNGTPTRTAIDAAGQFFMRSGTGLTNPYWQPDSSANGGQELACRQNFNLLVTDGYWNVDTPSAASYLKTSTSTALPDGKTYSPADATSLIYNGFGTDTAGNATLSNIAFHYWAKNLRPDFATKFPGVKVPAYIADTMTGVTGAAVTDPSRLWLDPSDSNFPAEVYFNPNNDPATWPHMVQFAISLGAGGALSSSPNDLDCTAGSANDACALRKGQKNSTGSIGWPQPNGTGGGIPQNIDDTWHAAINSRGSFFLATDPEAMTTQLNNILNNVVGRGAQPAAASTTMNILTGASQGFVPGYNSTTWAGTLYKVPLISDPTDPNYGAAKPLSQSVWEAGCVLDGGTLDKSGSSPKCTQIGSDSATRAAARIIVSGQSPLRGIPTKSCSSGGLLGGLLCGVTNLLGNLIDGLTSTLGQVLGVTKFSALNQAPSGGVACQSGLLAPLVNGILTSLLGQQSAPAGCDGFANARIDYLRGDHGQEGAAAQAKFRVRASMLGAIMNSSPVYVSSATSGWADAFPSGSGEATAAAAGNTYQQFAVDQRSRPATLYVGAADGMLHAFDTVSGEERFAYLPAVQYNRAIDTTGKLVKNSAIAGITNGVTPPPGVDDTPVVADVFFNNRWRTILVGGLRLGGRGLFALDITDPASIKSESDLQAKVLWDIDNTTSVGSGSLATTPFKNLGYTYASQNIVRINCNSATNAACSGTGGTWAVLASSGYFPNADSGDPASSEAGASQTSLFVIDLASGKLIREIPTATNNQNMTVTSYGLSTPAAYDVGNDQATDVAVAGDLAGNVWRFDISDANPNKWSVDLLFQTYDPTTANTIGTQPISTEPIALRDATGMMPVWIFGTGKYLGKCDTTTSTATSGQSNCGPDSSAAIQSFYGIFDYGTKSGNYPVNKNGPRASGGVLVQQKMSEAADVRSVTNTPVSASANGGWQIRLNLGGIDAGERVVTTISPLFDSNNFIASTLIPGGDPCRPGLSGALMMLNGATGGAPIQDLTGSFGGANTSTSRVTGKVRRNDNAIPTKSDGISVLVPPGGGQYRVLFGGGVFPIDGAQTPHRGAWRQLLEMQ